MDPRPTPVDPLAGLRADARRSVTAILVAADRLLSVRPTAGLEEIAAAAGVARTTVHRRFATREALLQALSRWAVGRVVEAVAAARPWAVPPYVGLYQATVNVLRVKVDLDYTRDLEHAGDPVVAAQQAWLFAALDDLVERARDAGLVRPDVDTLWARRAYHALLAEAARAPAGPPGENGGSAGGTDGAAGDGAAGDDGVDVLATRVLDTFLAGVGGAAPATRGPADRP